MSTSVNFCIRSIISKLTSTEEEQVIAATASCCRTFIFSLLSHIFLFVVNIQTSRWLLFVVLSSVFASTVNAILMGFVFCTFSTLMLLLIKRQKYSTEFLLQRNVSIQAEQEGSLCSDWNWFTSSNQHKITKEIKQRTCWSICRFIKFRMNNPK